MKTIGELAHELGLTEQTLRNWEFQGVITPADRVTLRKARVWDDEKAQQILRCLDSL